jgi:hypothetical protein
MHFVVLRQHLQRARNQLATISTSIRQFQSIGFQTFSTLVAGSHSPPVRVWLFIPITAYWEYVSHGGIPTKHVKCELPKKLGNGATKGIRVEAKSVRDNITQLATVYEAP